MTDPTTNDSPQEPSLDSAAPVPTPTGPLGPGLPDEGTTDEGAVGLPDLPPCAECASKEVQPSRSVYPLDQVRIGGEARSFWRCSNCGARFLGPPAPEGGEKRRRRSKHDPLDGAIQRSRKQKQWIFPLLVVLATILAVIYVLDRRNTEAPAVTFPD